MSNETNNHEIKISIIVPCFNVERYIDRCMDSLVNQTIGIENIEIILINDASTDGTLDKLQKWESQYPENIMVITYEENLRQGGARNIGISYSTGEYIGFVDADDWVETDFYEAVYRIAKEGDFDVVKGKFERNKDEICKNGKDISDSKVIEYRFKPVEGGFYQYAIDKTGCMGEWGSVCTGIYRRTMIVNSGVLFPEGLSYEDNYWDACMKLYISSLAIIDKIVYHYFINEQSTVTSRNQIHQLDRLEIELRILEYYREKNVFQTFYDHLMQQFIERYYLSTMYILFLRFDGIPTDIVNEMRNTVKENFPDYRERFSIRTSSDRIKLLIDLLNSQEDITFEELAKIKLSYLESICEEKKRMDNR